jgi:hypothetical protein
MRALKENLPPVGNWPVGLGGRELEVGKDLPSSLETTRSAGGRAGNELRNRGHGRTREVLARQEKYSRYPKKDLPSKKGTW